MGGKVVREPQKVVRGERRDQESELGVGDEWEGEGIRRTKLGMGPEV